MPQAGYVPIQMFRTTTAANVPVLLDGEPAATTAAANVTKFWVGDGTAARLLLSNVATDSPLGTALYARLAGALFTGAPQWAGVPANDEDLANKEYVDLAVASAQLYAGVYNAATNTPDLTLSANHPTVNGAYFVVSTGGTITAGVPGVAGQTVNPGDHLVWDGTNFSIIPAGGMTQADGDARYLRLGAANTMTAGGSITMPAGYAPTAASLQVATAAYVDTAVSGFLSTVHTDGTSITGNGAATITTPGTGPIRILAVDGGVF